ncbi:helix-turn-helix domain-containing protein [Desulfosporosinus acididurans]|nr:helix-turn-helix transcriptional regulator [Desulfosporosinus acididurans]
MKQHKHCRAYDVMIKKGMRLKDLEGITGYSKSHLSQILNGKDCYLSTAQDIALALGEKVDYLWPDYFHNDRPWRPS